MNATRIAIVAAGLLLAATSTGLAQQGPACGCSQKLTAASGTSAVGTIRGTTSDVLMTVTSGLAPAAAGAALALGSRIMTGPKGSASLVFGGGCLVDLARNSAATVAAVSGNLCVRTSSMTLIGTPDRFGQAAVPVVPPLVPVAAPAGLSAVGGVAGVAVMVSRVMSDSPNESISEGQ